MASKNRLAGLAALAGVAVLVAACSNAGSGATTGATGVPATQATTTVAPATAGTGSAAPSAAAMTDTINIATDSSGGQYIVAANGMSLYLFTPDGDDMSTCKDTCAANWPGSPSSMIYRPPAAQPAISASPAARRGPASRAAARIHSATGRAR